MSKIDNNSIFKISYGLFVLSAKEGDKDNGCIINTVQQVTQEPLKITVAINKDNFTHDMIKRTGEFNVSVLTEDVPFEIFERFGFESGRDTNKLDGFSSVSRTENGIFYLTEYVNAVISGKVIEEVDCGTHTLFVAEVCAGMVVSKEPSVTYQYYFDHIKPKPQKKGYVCKICGYVYEGSELPDDFVCPWCKHGAVDFEEIK